MENVRFICGGCGAELVIDRVDSMAPGSNDPVTRFVACACCHDDTCFSIIIGEACDEARDEGYEKGKVDGIKEAKQ